MKEQAPYFPFWAKDWISSESTRLMSLAARGAYADLLAISWLSSDEPCSIPDDDVAIAKLLGVPPREWKTVASTVRKQFERTENGRLRNARLYAIHCEVDAKREKLSQSGKKGADRKWGGHNEASGQANGQANGVAIPRPIATRSRTKAREDQEPSGAPRSVAKKPPVNRSPQKPPSWLAGLAPKWDAKFGDGTFPYPKAGAALKRLVEAGHSTETIADYLGRYLEQTDAKYVNLHRFAETFDAYKPFTFSGPPVVDGWMSDELERLTRPDGYVPWTPGRGHAA